MQQFSLGLIFANCELVWGRLALDYLISFRCIFNHFFLTVSSYATV